MTPQNDPRKDQDKRKTIPGRPPFVITDCHVSRNDILFIVRCSIMFTGVKAWHQDAQKTLEDCPGMTHLDVKWRFPFLVLKGFSRRGVSYCKK